MYCPECGNQNPNSAKFCIQCGYKYVGIGDDIAKDAPANKINKEETQSEPLFQTLPTTRPPVVNRSDDGNSPARNATMILVPVIGVILLAVVVGYGLISNMEQQKRLEEQNRRATSGGLDPNNANVPVSSKSIQLRNNAVSQQDFQSGSVRSSAPQIGIKELVGQAFTIGAGQFYIVKFDVPKTWSNVRVVGTFNASGGNGNDVQVFITDENGLMNMKNGHSGKGWYNSGKTTVGDINVGLDPGTYYLVFSNTFSVFSNKAINANIKIQYEY